MPQPVEIETDLQLSDAQEAQVQMHSFNNVVNVISGELQILGKIMGRPGLLEKSLDLCDRLVASFADRQAALTHVREMETYKQTMLREINAALREHPIAPEHRPLVDESLANLQDILAVVDVRVRELLARQRAAGAWARMPSEEILAGLRQVFDSIARNARGEYGIVYDPAEQGPEDYLMAFRVQGAEEGHIRIPPVLVDCLRDLAANARKYTAPGGRIAASLVDDGEAVTLEVSDTGRGIPPEELGRVVGFGVRGSNTRPDETRGAGYGLTKAYYVCKQFGGRFFIASAPGEGTTVTLRLPRPERDDG
jgi:signal transduction histidine kinase